ncbi:hypothetical protein M0R45_031883 [Rubus argutus]|uniref:MATH domain-containing protein n=1 Tax=Rubus argutus TaxID=59490 RepID=A0AAW1WEZ2_RUBAR
MAISLMTHVNLERRSLYLKREEKTKERRVSMNLNTIMYKYVWKVADFSKLNAESYYSTPFMAGDQKYCTWKLLIYPKGNNIGTGSHLSVYLFLDNTQFPTGAKIFAEFTIRIIDQNHGKHCSFQTNYWFDAIWVVLVEAEITIRGISVPGISTL